MKTTRLKKIIKESDLLFSLYHIIKRMFEPAIKGENNKVIKHGFVNGLKFNIKGNNNQVIIELGAIIESGLIYILGDNHLIHIGHNVTIKKGELWIEDSNSQIIIGDNVSIEEAHIAVTGNRKKIVIGDDCMLSHQVTLRTGDSHAIIDNTNKMKINEEQDIIVGHHVWLGNGATILKGVVNGSHSIVGTKSLVTKSVPENSLIAGVPAKVIKSNIDWKRDRF